MTEPDQRDGDGLRAKLIEFDCFLNEPPPYEDKTMVRDYRHSAYAKWSSLCADVVKLIDAPPKPSPAIMRERFKYDLQPAPDVMRELADKIRYLHNRGLLEYHGDYSITDDEYKLLIAVLIPVPVLSPE